jgi:hypothetical protein
LLRPGRFDRQIVVDRPDLAGRRQILSVHSRGKPLADSVDLDVLARRTPGFTGADLANLLNEAAILTARRNLRQIGMRECEEAIERVLAGPERKTLVMSDHDKLVTAYHEAGHAVVGHVLLHADPIHKVSIVARSRALGLTFTLPEDRYNHSRSQLRDAMAMCLGGRTAEELAFEEPTTGAENDIEKVTRIARAMVTEYGMSDALGPQQLGQPNNEVFLGREFGHQPNYSEEVASAIDREVRRMIDEAHDRAWAVLTVHRATLDRMAHELVERETLDALDLEEILGPLDPWPVGDDAASSRARPPRRDGRAARAETATAPLDPTSPEAALPGVIRPQPPPARVAKRSRSKISSGSSGAGKPAPATGAKPVPPATAERAVSSGENASGPAAQTPGRRRRPTTPADDPAAAPRSRPRPEPLEP